MNERGGNKAILSFTDYKILRFLVENNNSSNKKISKQINVSEGKVGGRLKHLELIKLIDRKKSKIHTQGIINYIKEKNKTKIKDFLKLVKLSK